jgi:hypothetical protein
MHTKNLSFFSSHWIFWAFIATVSVGLCLINAWLGFPYVKTLNGTYSALNGVIPYSDANGYLAGGQYFREMGYFDYWNMRRPLNALFFAFRLNITGGNFWYVMGIQVGLCAVALTLYLKVLHDHLRGLAPFFALVFVIIYANDFLHTTLSETLGLTLGLFSFVLLWNGYHDRNRFIFCLGTAALTIALSARAGPNFIIPALFLLVYLQPFSSSQWKDLLWCVISFGIPFVLMMKLSSLFGNPNMEGAAYANFSHTLFGLVSGGKTWTHAYNDSYVSALLADKTEAEAAQILYQESWRAFKSNPFHIFVGMGKNLIGFTGYFFKIFAVGSGIVKYISTIINALMMIFIGFKIYTNRLRFPREFLFLAIITAGIFASSCIIWVDGHIRPFAVAIPFMGALLGFAFAGAPQKRQTSFGNVPAIGFVSFVVLGSVFNGYMPSSNTPPDTIKMKIPQVTGHQVVLTYSPKKQPHIFIKNRDGLHFLTVSPSKIKGISGIYSDSNLGEDIVFLINKYGNNNLVIIYVYDFISHQNKYIVSEEHILHSNAEWITIDTNLVDSHFKLIYKANNYTEMPNK